MPRACRLVALITALALVPAAAAAQTDRDDFDHMGQINKASIVMLTEVGLVPESLGAVIASGIGQVLAEQAEPGARRSGDYLVFEERLVEVAGRDASRLHTGRSRQDIGSTVSVGQFTEDVHIQYHDPVPWLLLDRSLTGISSIMPQKRNPIALERLRQLSSTVVGDGQTVLLTAHNTSTGMIDYRSGTQVIETADKARRMYAAYADIVNNLEVDPERSLAEVDADYATMTEVADTLLRHADVPFRVGHHYASELTEYGRAHGKRPKELTTDELLHIYEETYGEPLPVSVDLIQEALDPERMVAGRRGLGGPQPEETTRMVRGGRQRLDASQQWLDAARAALQGAETTLEAAFDALAAQAPAK